MSPSRKYGDIEGYEGKHLSFIEAWCISHIFFNAGKNFYNNKATPFLDVYRQRLKQIIQYEDNARDLAKGEIGAGVKESGGVRFYTHCEKIVQIVDYGLENILSDIVPTCIENKW